MFFRLSSHPPASPPHLPFLQAGALPSISSTSGVKRSLRRGVAVETENPPCDAIPHSQLFSPAPTSDSRKGGQVARSSRGSKPTRTGPARPIVRPKHWKCPPPAEDSGTDNKPSFQARLQHFAIKDK